LNTFPVFVSHKGQPAMHVAVVNKQLRQRAGMRAMRVSRGMPQAGARYDVTAVH